MRSNMPGSGETNKHTQFFTQFDRDVMLTEGDSKITHVCQDGQDDVKEEYCSHRSGLEFEAKIVTDEHVWQQCCL